jgi:sortase B
MKIKRFLKADRSFQEQVREHDNSPYAKLSRIEKAGHAYESEDDDDFEEVIIEEYDEDEENRKRWKKRIINLVFDSLIVAGVVMLVYGGYSLYTYHKDNQESKESYEKLEDEGFVKVELPTLVPTPNGSENSGENSTESARPKEWYEQIWVDLEGLQTKVNSDIIGWIFFENEEISYPILHSDDNSKYERVRYDNVFATSGSIFLEANNKGDFSEKRNIIYGHNMKDMTMFGRLHYYRDRSYYDTHKYFQVIHDGMVYRYQVFSYFEIMETEVDYIDVNFASEEEYAAIFKKMTTNGMHQLDVPVTMEDKTITLLTCTGAEDRRYIVNAVLVDQHALANADGTYPGEENNTENNTENGTDTPSTETQQPDTPDNKPEDKPKYTYTEMYKIMWAKVSVKIRNQPTVDSVRIGFAGEGQQVTVIAKCNENT